MPGLLLQLAAGGVDGGFAFFERAGGELDEVLVEALPQVADEQDLVAPRRMFAAAGEGQDHDRAGMDDDFLLDDRSGEFVLVSLQLELEARAGVERALVAK